MTVLRSIGLTLLLASPVPFAHAQTTTKHVISLEAAKTIVEAAEAEASRRETSVVIAVVDDGGYPILIERMDDTQPLSVETGIAKARTAAIFRRSTKTLRSRDGGGGAPEAHRTVMEDELSRNQKWRPGRDSNPRPAA